MDPHPSSLIRQVEQVFLESTWKYCKDAMQTCTDVKTGVNDITDWEYSLYNIHTDQNLKERYPNRLP